MIKVFKEISSRFYDELNQKKDYATEVSKICSIIGQCDDKDKSLLDLGCGSGSHIPYFLENGFSVTGVDISADMVDVAKIKLAKFIPDRVKLKVCDITRYEYSKNRFNVVTCLYSVLGYMQNTKEIQHIFNSVSKCLLPGGVFILDLWNAKIVESLGPTARTKEFTSEGTTYKRLSQPKINKANQTVEVEFTYFIDDKIIEAPEEIHLVRYFNVAEVENYAKVAGFQSCEQIVHPNKLAFDNTGWNSIYVLRN